MVASVFSTFSFAGPHRLNIAKWTRDACVAWIIFSSLPAVANAGTTEFAVCLAHCLVAGSNPVCYLSCLPTLLIPEPESCNHRGE